MTTDHVIEEDGLSFLGELEHAQEEASRAEWQHTDVAEVIRAYIASPEGYGSVDIAGVVRLNDGRIGAVRGWADTTGWDCQSDAEFSAHDNEDAAVRWGLDTDSRRWPGYDEPALGTET